MTVIPAVLGWSNPTTGPAEVRVYAADVPNSRWHGEHGRIVEDALTEQGAHEGDRLLVVRLGGRFVSDEQRDEVAARVQAVLVDAGLVAP